MRGGETTVDGDAGTTGDEPLTSPGTAVGTVTFMSPEQVRGEELDVRSDLFSFGAVLYEMATGRQAFTGNTSGVIFDSILHKAPTSLVRLNPDCPFELERIVNKALEKDRKMRYQSAAELRIDLARLKRDTDSGRRVSQATGETAVPPFPVTTSAWRKWILGLAAMSLMVAGGVWFFFVRPTPEASLPPMDVVPLTTFPGRETQPALSPDGKQVAFAWDGEKGDNFDIYIQLIGAGRPLRLTTDPASDGYPTWSPDGRRIAFSRRMSETETAIFTVPALGGPERKLHTATWASSVGNRPLSWSPDGKHLAFIGPRPNDDRGSVHVLSLETLEKHSLTSLPATSYRENFPAYSPDGKTLAFVRAEHINAGDIHVVPSDGGEPKRLTFDGEWIRGLTWSADGSRIIFSSPRRGPRRLWAIPASGGEPEQLLVGEGGIQPSISQQGERLVYRRSTPPNSDIWRIEMPSPKDETGPPTRIIASTQWDGAPRFSPDGNRIVFSSSRSGRDEIWVCNSDGSDPMQLTSIASDAGTPRWSPDGQWIAFDNQSRGGSDIYVVSSDAGPVRRLTGDGASESMPSWSRDGKWIYFTSNRGGTWQIWKMPAEGGEEVQITKKGGVSPFESPDGKFIYYAKGRYLAGLWKVPVDGGEEEQVFDHPKPRYYLYWIVVEDGIFYVNPDTKSIEFFSFANRRIKRIVPLERNPLGGYTSGGLSLSPDGRWLLYRQAGLGGGADLMLVENFRVE